LKFYYFKIIFFAGEVNSPKMVAFDGWSKLVLREKIRYPLEERIRR